GSLGNVAARSADDAAALDEQIAHLDGRGEQSTGVESQVQNQPGHAGLLQLLQCPFEFRRGMSPKGSQANVTDFLLFIQEVAPAIVRIAMVAENRLDPNRLAFEREQFGFL